ncbi:uncharacterized protein LOC144865785 [Branchiostoma floridae x Branchiostoma japonicum]
MAQGGIKMESVEELTRSVEEFLRPKQSTTSDVKPKRQSEMTKPSDLPQLSGPYPLHSQTPPGLQLNKNSVEVTVKELVDATTHLANVVTGCCTEVKKLGGRLDHLESPEGIDTVRKTLWNTNTRSVAGGVDTVRKTHWKTNTRPAAPHHVSRKEFKIIGQVGTLSFKSLTYQVNSGLKQGYTEEEVVDAVIRAIPAESALRSYLEGKEMDLETVEQVVKAQCPQCTATDLYRKLSMGKQANEESPQNFLMRMMDLRDRVIEANEEEDELYSAGLVQAMFLRAVLTGLSDDAIRLEIQPHLDRKCGTTDVELLEKVGRAVIDKQEREEKKRSAARVNTTDTNTTRTGINVVTARSRRLCDQCWQARAERCNHCFVCGRTNHQARECRSQAAPRGNESRALPRDGE